MTPTIVGTNDDDVIEGTPGDDVILGLNGEDLIFGLGGNDAICGGNGIDEIYGGDGNDMLNGGNGDDRVFGGHGDDRVVSEDETDERGDDLLDGGPGEDVLDGSRGSDECRFGETVLNCETVPPNQAPVADAGEALNALIYFPATLDGSASYDPDFDLITYAWTLVEAPVDSVAVLDAATVVQPVFFADLPGTYRFELVVSDGALFSSTATVEVTAFAAGSPPNARAGRDREALAGATAQLDGSASSDPEGYPLTYDWSFQSVPAGSAVTDDDLADSTTPTPSFVPDVDGTYAVTLTVSDAGLVDSDTVEVFVAPPNLVPTIDPGQDVAFTSGAPIFLDSSASFDPDGGPEPLAFDWALVSRPAGSSLADADLDSPSSASVGFTPDVEGAYVFRLTGDDGAAADAENVVVVVDDAPPQLEFLTPADGATLDDDRPDFNLSFLDSLSGIDLGSFQLIVNGDGVTGDVVLRTLDAFYAPPLPLPNGLIAAQATVADRAGNQTTVTIQFTVETEVFRAIADCSPQSGVIPLSVRFRSRGEFSGGSIVRYRWDFQGDGIFDTSDPVARDYTRVFTTAGTRNSVLEVTNNFGDKATDVCTIVVSGSAPAAAANAVPSNGEAPLTVNFTCTGSDADGSIVLYEWDFEGDGIFDYSSPASGSTTHTYSGEGEFEATCRVTDNDGLTATARTTNTVIRPGPPGSPSVTASASPTTGNAPLNVSLNGTATDDGTIVLYEWDFEGDGVYDYSSPSSAAVIHSYTGGGVFSATLRVTDDEGLSAMDNIEIVVNISATLSIPDDTFNPTLGETASVRTTLTGGVPARVLILDRDGLIRRTLVDELRAAGTYLDPWDGTDDSGFPLPHGPYFAVLEYDFAGEIRRVDLTDTTGGTRYNPSRNNLGGTFRPLEDDLLDITFTIPSSRGASEVTAFVGLFRVDTRFVTLLEREPFGVGTHTIQWDGTDPSGSIAVPPPGDSFLFGIFGFTQPDNAIMLHSAPILSGVRADPNFYDPSTPGFVTPDDPTTILTYNLDRLADVELTVTNLTTGTVLRRIVQPGVPGGTGHTVEWDGRTDTGVFADRGDYRLSLQAIDSSGSVSLTRFALVRVFY